NVPDHLRGWQAGDVGELETRLERRSAQVIRDVAAALDEFAFQRALTAIWAFVGSVNGYVDTTQPWALAKDETQRTRLDVVLYALGESLRFLGIMLTPFLPDAATKIRVGLGQSGEPTLADAVRSEEHTSELQ